MDDHDLLVAIEDARRDLCIAVEFKGMHTGRASIETLIKARYAIAKLISERNALRLALNTYPDCNTHQLQARKVCEGVKALAITLESTQGISNDRD